MSNIKPEDSIAWAMSAKNEPHLCKAVMVEGKMWYHEDHPRLRATPTASGDMVSVPREAADFVPGQMRCARCNFGLTRISLNVNVGTVTAGDTKTEPCPNGCGPLWPITWEQWSRDGWDAAEAQALRAVDAERALADLQARLGPALARPASTQQVPMDEALMKQALDAMEATHRFLPGYRDPDLLRRREAVKRAIAALRQRLAADAQPLEAKADERDQALQFLAGLHPELTIDGPPMAVAERIWDAVMSDREALADKIKNMERNLENFRQHFARAGSPPAQSEGSRASIEEQHDRIMGPRGRFR